MQIESLQQLFGVIDLFIITVAVIVCIIMTVLKKVLKNKLKTSVSIYLPTVLAIFIQFLIKLIIYGFDRVLTVETLYDGLISGSFSTVISVIITRLLSGKPLTSPIVMIIEGILGEIVKKEHIESVTEEIMLVIEEQVDDQTKTQKLAEIIFNYTNLEMDDTQVETLSVFILKSVSQIKK